MPATIHQLKEALRKQAATLGVEPAVTRSDHDPPIDFAVSKSDDEHRYTFGVMYVPGAVDADDEWVEANDLQKATWDYLRKGYRGIRDTHTDVEIGELVELVSWPYEAEVEARTGSGEVRKMKLPAGTVYAGVVWTPDAWALVKSGKLRGYSMGGKAVRLKEAATDADLPRMRDLAEALEPEVRKDYPLGMSLNDRVAWAEDIENGSEKIKKGVIVGLGVDDFDGAVTHEVRWEDGSSSFGVRGFALRNLKGDGDL
jgi:hypothetical protein